MLWGGPFAVGVLLSCRKACVYVTRVAPVPLTAVTSATSSRCRAELDLTSPCASGVCHQGAGFAPQGHTCGTWRSTGDRWRTPPSPARPRLAAASPARCSVPDTVAQALPFSQSPAVVRLLPSPEDSVLRSARPLAHDGVVFVRILLTRVAPGSLNRGPNGRRPPSSSLKNGSSWCTVWRGVRWLQNVCRVGAATSASCRLRMCEGSPSGAPRGWARAASCACSRSAGPGDGPEPGRPGRSARQNRSG